MPGRRARPHDPRMDEFDELAILALVAAAPTHPYAVLDHLGTAGISTSRSALYRYVDALVADGALAQALQAGEHGPARRRLTLTGRGHERLAWLADRAIRQLPLQSPLFALAIGGAECIGEDRLSRLLKDRLAAAARDLTAHERDLGASPGPGRLKQEREVVHLRADVGWLQHALARRLAS